jgi:hypothetical protein
MWLGNVSRQNTELVIGLFFFFYSILLFLSKFSYNICIRCKFRFILNK